MLPIYIDNIAFYLQKSGGITVVWVELISRLIKKCKCVYFLNFKMDPKNIFYKIISQNLNVCRCGLFSLTLQRYLPMRLKHIKQHFIFHSTYYRYSTNPFAINITTVHDFTYEYFSSGLRKKIHCWQKYRAIKKSQYIICISENTRKDLLYFLPDIPLDKIKVIYNGVSDDYYPVDKWNGGILPFKKCDYLLFVGAREGYKNFDFIVKALKKSEYKLVIVGADLLDDEIRMLDENLINRYFYMGRLSNSDLNNLYNGAYALIYPSSYEGFGIPVLEAQKAGCPVIAYNASSIPEIIGDTTLLMNNLVTNELLDKLSILKDKKVRKEIIRKGYKNAQKYSWDKSFEELIKVYEEAERLLIEN